MKLKIRKPLRTLITGFALSLSLGWAGGANAGFIFAGDWELGNGIRWSTGLAPTLTAQQAAAQLFGGIASDYVISSVDSNVANINFSAWYDTYAVGPRILAQNYYSDLNSNGLYDQAGDSSAYVLDNDSGCSNRYSNPNALCSSNPNHNFAFKITAVPEPGSLALLGLGLAGLAVARNRKRA